MSSSDFREYSLSELRDNTVVGVILVGSVQLPIIVTATSNPVLVVDSSKIATTSLADAIARLQQPQQAVERIVQPALRPSNDWRNKKPWRR